MVVLSSLAFFYYDLEWLFGNSSGMPFVLGYVIFNYPEFRKGVAPPNIVGIACIYTVFHLLLWYFQPRFCIRHRSEAYKTSAKREVGRILNRRHIHKYVEGQNRETSVAARLLKP